jgi:serine/threonine protein kinase
MQPLVAQICSAVRLLHELGIVHRDISIENILLTRDERGEEHVRLIDFGMSVLSRECCGGVRCKASYQAPEEHWQGEWDGFLSDAFGVGVVIFVMAVHDYPWESTKAWECERFEYVQARGFHSFLRKRKLRLGNGEVLKDVLSSRLAGLLSGLLMLHPDSRATLGESCWEASLRSSVWERRWLTSSLALPTENHNRLKPDLHESVSADDGAELPTVCGFSVDSSKGLCSPLSEPTSSVQGG